MTRTADIIIFPGVPIERMDAEQPTCVRCKHPFARIDHIPICEPCRDKRTRRGQIPDFTGGDAA